MMLKRNILAACDRCAGIPLCGRQIFLAAIKPAASGHAIKTIKVKSSFAQ
jgi:hypothetical protein